jgi:hypothetical protein
VAADQPESCRAPRFAAVRRQRCECPGEVDGTVPRPGNREMRAEFARLQIEADPAACDSRPLEPTAIAS